MLLLDPNLLFVSDKADYPTEAVDFPEAEDFRNKFVLYANNRNRR